MKFRIGFIRKRLFLRFFTALISAGIIGIVCINIYINNYSRPYIFNDPDEIPETQAVLALGAQVYASGALSHILYDRMIRSIELYEGKRARKILLSGDHGTKYYDEVNTMKSFLLKYEIPSNDIFLDHAGFNTYDSVIRAKKVFLIKDVVIVTQKFHLPRALFIARKNGLNAYGCISDRRTYRGMTYYKFREIFANIKAFIYVLFEKNPHFLGEEIPISGNGMKSWD